jgi:hypothetical protein
MCVCVCVCVCSCEFFGVYVCVCVFVHVYSPKRHYITQHLYRQADQQARPLALDP